nr:MAG TPA: hypothetical protein [Caudoviricetes sp.]
MCSSSTLTISYTDFHSAFFLYIYKIYSNTLNVLRLLIYFSYNLAL